MTERLVDTPEVQTLLDNLSGKDTGSGDPRLKAIIRRVVGDLFAVIDEFDVSEDEFWQALNYVAAGAPEFGLCAAGLGIERFLDIRADAQDAAAGIADGTPRTIEGPLYVAGAPEEKGFARLDDGTDQGELLYMHGQVRDVSGKPLAGARVEVWHANTLGNYSFFDKTQSDFNLRRTIVTDADGRYAFRSIVPAGYACPPGGSTEGVLQRLGRHGNRPAHIHFLASADAHRHLTTQTNIDGDPYLRDDFAYATREDLIPAVNYREGEGPGAKHGLEGRYAEIEFDFVLQRPPIFRMWSVPKRFPPQCWRFCSTDTRMHARGPRSVIGVGCPGASCWPRPVSKPVPIPTARVLPVTRLAARLRRISIAI